MHKFDYPFDDTCIATDPLKERDQSRLLIYDRSTDRITHQRFFALLDFLRPNDLLVINDTRVFPARLFAGACVPSTLSSVIGLKPTDIVTSTATYGNGSAIPRAGTELLLIRPASPEPQSWEALVKGRVSVPSTLMLPEGGRVHLIEDLGEGKKKIVFELPEKTDLVTYLNKWGEVPLPPYILRRRKAERGTDALTESDPQTYQTVYAKQIGSVAAPTAGLHFTEPMLTAIKAKGVTVATVTLHIGPDTFRPIHADSLDQHKMSGEWFAIPDETAYAFEKARASGGRVFAVGTSVVRSLESAVKNGARLVPMERETDLFITPGYSFRAVDALITNLHPPRSTGLVLVSAFVGHETVLRLYHEAMEQQYRFFSYGDAMLIL